MHEVTSACLLSASISCRLPQDLPNVIPKEVYIFVLEVHYVSWRTYVLLFVYRNNFYLLRIMLVQIKFIMNK
jgi:hypothetical protein